MHALRSVLRNLQPALLLWAQELALFSVLYGGLFIFLTVARGDSWYAWQWEPAFFPAAFGSPAAAAALGLFLLLPCALFGLARLWLLGGAIGALASGWTGLDDFMRDGRRAFWRFLTLALLYAIPAALLWGATAAAFRGLDGFVDDTRWPVWSLALRGMTLFLLLTPLAFLHAEARFRTLATGRLRLAFRPRRKPLLAFYGYSAIALALTVPMGWAVLELSRGTTGWGVIPWVLAFQTAALARLVFRLAAWMAARPTPPAPAFDGPTGRLEADGQPPRMILEEPSTQDAS